MGGQLKPGAHRRINGSRGVDDPDTPLGKLDLSKFIESLPDALFVVDTEGTIQLVNSQAETLFGYKKQELLGQMVDMLVPDSVKRVHPKHRAKYFSNPSARPMGAGVELSARRRDGSEFPVDISLSSIDTEHGTLVSAAVRDITDRKRSEAKFQGLLESAPDAIVGVGRDGLIRLANRQAEVLFGYDRSEMIGNPIEMLVPDRVRDAHPGHRSKYFAHPTSRAMGAGLELSARRKDGSEFPVDISLSSLETEEGIIVSAAVRDISDLVRVQQERALERRRHQSERLESLGSLAGGIAHDFNNLLAAITNYVSLITKALKKEVDDRGSSPRMHQVSEDITQIGHAAERAADLTHRLLVFGRREVVRPEVLNFNSIVLDTQKLLSRTIGEHIELRSELADDLANTFVDRSQLEQVLMNLAVNARDAMRDEGVLTIKSRNVEFTGQQVGLEPQAKSGLYACLEVSDTGTGMSKEVISRAFEPFFSTKPKGEGSGLGLATVYGIVSQAGGHLHLYSELGFGTTFKIYFPAVIDEVEGTSSAPVIANTNGAGERILLVEDEEFVRESTRRILSEAGYEVVSTGSPRDALSLALDNGKNYDLLLTDVMMPEMSGTELASKLEDRWADIRVLYMSGYSPDLVAERGVLNQGVSLLEKPFSDVSLLMKVKEIMGERLA